MASKEEWGRIKSLMRRRVSRRMTMTWEFKFRKLETRLEIREKMNRKIQILSGKKQRTELRIWKLKLIIKPKEELD